MSRAALEAVCAEMETEDRAVSHPAEPPPDTEQDPLLSSITSKPRVGKPSAGTTISAPSHNKDMASEFLAILDPKSNVFTFQFFADSGPTYAEIVHGTLDEAWPKIHVLNTPERCVGAFVTINQTDFQGRRRENVVRARALWVDADSADQLRHCNEVIQATGGVPTMVVRTSADRAHYYWCCDDIALKDFSAQQAALIEALGTDSAVKDLPRVMRLPGTLHLKDPTTLN